MTTPTLFSPLTIRSVTFRNRIWVPPMCQYSVIAEDGVPTAWHHVHLGSKAAGGAGLIIAEATAVTPEGRISPRDCGIWNDAQRDAWKPIVEFIRGQGAVAGIQLAHAGRKASIWPDWGFEDKSGTKPVSEGGWQTIAPSAIEFPSYLPPREMTDGDILNVEHAFVAAAKRAVEAGFQVLEIHAAHGYLLHEFLSPLSNKRSDEYGGALENRARLLVSIVKQIRAAIGEETVLFVRFSATDWTPEGWNEEECAVVADWCLNAGADLFDISSGGNITGVSIPVGQGDQVPLANFIQQHAHGPTAAVGMITDAEYANSVISSGQADAVLIGREFLRDPHWALHAAASLGAQIDYWPEQYKRAKPKY
jgi:2,4-dienoyl-CoA reductase-like NADH-dependent reductase (Old Yellow Enzyme family)